MQFPSQFGRLLIEPRRGVLDKLGADLAIHIHEGGSERVRAAGCKRRRRRVIIQINHLRLQRRSHVQRRLDDLKPALLGIKRARVAVGLEKTELILHEFTNRVQRTMLFLGRRRKLGGNAARQAVALQHLHFVLKIILRGSVWNWRNRRHRLVECLIVEAFQLQRRMRSVHRGGEQTDD